MVKPLPIKYSWHKRIDPETHIPFYVKSKVKYEDDGNIFSIDNEFFTEQEFYSSPIGKADLIKQRFNQSSPE